MLLQQKWYGTISHGIVTKRKFFNKNKKCNNPAYPECAKDQNVKKHKSKTWPVILKKLTLWSEAHIAQAVERYNWKLNGNKNAVL